MAGSAAAVPQQASRAPNSIDLMPDFSQPIVQAAGLSKVVKLNQNAANGTPGADELVILQDISLKVMPGEAVAIVGASGSGKSTLLGLLAGLDTPSSGRVRLDGADLFGLDEDGRAALRARLLGFVFQSFQLLPALNALENVMLPLELAGDPGAADLAAKMLARVGLGERLRHYPKTLSGGEQQRVALARAFVTQPKLLLADEPTGNLDAATGAGVIDLMFEMNAEARTTLLLVTHDEAIAGRRAANRRRSLIGDAAFRPPDASSRLARGGAARPRARPGARGGRCLERRFFRRPRAAGAHPRGAPGAGRRRADDRRPRLEPGVSRRDHPAGPRPRRERELRQHGEGGQGSAAHRGQSGDAELPVAGQAAHRARPQRGGRGDRCGSAAGHRLAGRTDDGGAQCPPWRRGRARPGALSRRRGADARARPGRVLHELRPAPYDAAGRFTGHRTGAAREPHQLSAARRGRAREGGAVRAMG